MPARSTMRWIGILAVVAAAAIVAVLKVWEGDEARSTRPPSIVGPTILGSGPESKPNDTPIATAPALGAREAAGSPVKGPREAPKVGFRIAGDCTDTDGTPLAEVDIASKSFPNDPMPRKSDASGRFLVSGPPPGGEEPWTIDLVFRKLGYARTTIHTAAQSDRVTELGKVVMRAGAIVRGRIIDESGKGVGAARVEFNAPGEQGYLDVPIEKDGTFRWDTAPCGALTFRARARDGVESEAVGLTLTPGAEAEVLLKLPGDDADMIVGIVLTPDGAPSPQASLSFGYKLGNRSGSSGIAVDADGRFRFRPQEKTNYTIRARDKKDVFAPVVLEGVAPGTKGLEIRLGVAKHFEIRVVGPRNAAVERYAYRLLDKVGMASLGTHAEEDHKDGIAKLVAPTEKFSVFIDATGFETQTVGPFEANNIPTAIDVRLAAIPGVRGIVTLDSKPVGGARVRAVKAVGATSNLEINGYRAIAYNNIAAQAATAPDGTFFLPIRNDDQYYVRAQSEGFAESEIGPLRIVGKEGLTGLQLRLGPGGILEGRALGLPGESTAGVIVGISRGDGAPKTQRADANGNYRFALLTPGPYQVRRADKELVSGVGNTSMEVSGGAVPPIVWDCEVVEGKVTNYDLLLGSVRPVDIVATLRINGASPPGFQGMLATSSGPGGGWMSDNEATIDGEGRFHMRASKPGAYLVILRSGGDRHPEPSFEVSVNVDAVAGENPVRVDLATGRIEGTVANPNDRDNFMELRQEAGPMRVVARTKIAPDGTFTFESAPAGKCNLLRHGRSTTPIAVDVTAAQTVKAEIP